MMPENDDQAVLILAQRTRENLKYIDEKKSQCEPVSEFTQLLNSMLGMVISLREEYVKGPSLSQEDVQYLEGLQKQTALSSISGNLPHRKRPSLRLEHFTMGCSHTTRPVIVDRAGGQRDGTGVFAGIYASGS